MSYVQTPCNLGFYVFCSVPPMVHYSPPTDTVGLQLEQPDRRAYLQLYQSFRDIGNVTGPLMGAAISGTTVSERYFSSPLASCYSTQLFMEQSTSSSNTPGIELIFRFHTCKSGESAILFPETSSTQGRIVMTMYATLEEAIDAARKNFLQTTPASTPKMRMCNSSCPKIRFAGRRHHVAS